MCFLFLCFSTRHLFHYTQVSHRCVCICLCRIIGEKMKDNVQAEASSRTICYIGGGGSPPWHLSLGLVPPETLLNYQGTFVIPKYKCNKAPEILQKQTPSPLQLRPNIMYALGRRSYIPLWVQTIKTSLATPYTKLDGRAFSAACTPQQFPLTLIQFKILGQILVF